MARKLREFKYDNYYHVYNKFNPELSIPDHTLIGLCDILKQAKKRFNVEIVNYSFYNNHFHLKLFFKQKNQDKSSNKCNISKVMHWIGLKIAKYVNYVLKRHGKVFFDRFKSKIINNVSYFFTLFKYIINNVSKHRGIESKKWPYSGYNFYINGTYDEIITHFNNLIDIDI